MARQMVSSDNASDAEPGDACAPKRLTDIQFKQRLIETMPHLRAFARSLTHDPATADDLVQDTLLKTWAARKRFQPEKSMRVWTFVILRNTYFSQFRRKKFEGHYIEEEADRLLVTEAAQESPLHLADLHNALTELTDDQREAIILVGAGGFSYKEAAEIAGCAVGTIKSRVSRAREGLVTIIERRYATQTQAPNKMSGSDAMKDIVEAVTIYTQAT